MAIIVEEEKNKGNVVAILGWLVILAIVGAAIYYVFFSAPELVIIPPTGVLSTIAPIATIKLNPQDVVNSAAYQSLHSAIPLPTPQGPATVGRANPFVAP